ncbi:MAG: ORF6N domain-containing protein [Coriobacteriia bacterium]|nr:ORF6N domain-containing protein [Actinomycetota bacterium]MDZ4167097.1 ORF6N domain-containing protein [Coriobacteriia bacterium]
MTDETALVPVEAAELRIRVARDTRVILDADLAALYDVETRTLVQAVRRNPDRFPADFMFELTPDEWAALKSGTSDPDGWGGRRTPPLAFTEQGIAMLSSVLRSSRAVAVNVQIMRAFVRLREILAENANLSRRLDDLEQRYDEQFKIIIQAIQALTAPPSKPRNPVGFRP